MYSVICFSDVGMTMTPPAQVHELLGIIDANLERLGEGAAYTAADLAAHSENLTAAQRATLANPLSPEKQEERCRQQAGHVVSMKHEIGGLKQLMTQMTAEQNQIVQAVVAQMSAKMAPAPPT